MKTESMGFPMPADTGLKKNSLRAFSAGKEKFMSFERVYRLLRPHDLAYLREQSDAYRQAVLAVQDLILPAVRKRCPQCAYGTCCRLSTPELNIYIPGSIGGFFLIDYLLARCDRKLPAAKFANGRRNLCPFWDNGCRLEPDRRSLLCLQYFCQPLRRELDMDLVDRRVADVKAVVDNFSMNRLLRR